jgi:hypothetical protein
MGTDVTSRLIVISGTAQGVFVIRRLDVLRIVRRRRRGARLIVEHVSG